MPEDDDIFKHEYSVTPSRFVKMVTGIVIVIIVIVMIVVAIIPLFPEVDEDYPEDEEGELWLFLFLSVGIPILMIAVLILPYLYIPKKYATTSSALVIERSLSPISIPYSSIKNIYHDPETNYLKSIRLWGNGGLYGFTGTFRNSKLGKFYMYARNNNYVVIEAQKKYVISPDEAPLLVQDVMNQLKKGKKDATGTSKKKK